MDKPAQPSPSSPKPVDEKQGETSAPLPPEVLVALAKSGSLPIQVSAPKGLAKLQRRFRYFIYILLMFGLWIIMAMLMWVAEPAPVVYEKARIGTPAGSVMWGRRFSIDLPRGWEITSVSGQVYGPNGSKLFLKDNRMVYMRMSPKTIQGKVIHDRYTGVAYGNGLLDRLKDAREVLWTRYLTLGEENAYGGVEACLGVKGEDTPAVYRCFAVVDDARYVHELVFLLPQGEGSAMWSVAEEIFRSLHLAPLPPKKKPAAPARKQ